MPENIKAIKRKSLLILKISTNNKYRDKPKRYIILKGTKNQARILPIKRDNKKRLGIKKEILRE